MDYSVGAQPQEKAASPIEPVTSDATPGEVGSIPGGFQPNSDESRIPDSSLPSGLQSGTDTPSGVATGVEVENPGFSTAVVPEAARTPPTKPGGNDMQPDHGQNEHAHQINPGSDTPSSRESTASAANVSPSEKHAGTEEKRASKGGRNRGERKAKKALGGGPLRKLADEFTRQFSELFAENAENHSYSSVRPSRDLISIGKSGDVIIQNGVAQESKKKETLGLLQATFTITGAAASNLSPEPTHLTAWTVELRSSRVLFLRSPDLGALHAAGEAIAAEFSDWERRVLRFRSSERGPVTADSVIHRSDGGPEKCLVVVEAIDSQAAPFVDSVIGSRMALSEVRTALRDSVRLLLVLTTDAVLAWQHRREEEREYVPHGVVPFLGPRLRHHFPERWRDLSEEIGRQQARGLWGNDDQTFHRLILDALTNGALDLEVERRLGAITVGDLNRAKEVHPEELFDSRNELEISSLFLAAFFPRLPVADFERALLALVNGLSEEIRTTEFVLTSEGMGISSEVTRSRPLAEAWREQRVAILKRCKLGIVIASTQPDLGAAPNAPRVDFALPYLHSDVHTLFLSTHFLTFLELARRARSLGFVFDPCLELRDNAVALLVDLEERIPGELSRARLHELFTIAFSDGSLRLEAFDGLYRLSRAMLQSFDLHYTSDSIFRELLAAGVGAEVPRLATLLHGVGGFDSYSWIRRLLDEGGSETNARTYFYLLGMLLRSGAGTADLLSRIGAWLPAPDAIQEKGTPQSTQDALSLLLDAAQVLLLDGRPRTGVWPPKDQVLATLVSSGSNLESVVVRWLLHPAGVRLLEPNLSSHLLHWTVRWRIPSELGPVASLLTEDLQNYLEVRWEPTLDLALRDAKLLGITSPWGMVFPAMVLADWAVQLLCSREPEPPPDALQTFERILAEVLAVAGRFERRALILFWSTLEESVVDVLLSLNEIAPGTLAREALTSVRKDLQRRGWAIRQLRSRFSAWAHAYRSSGESADARPNP